MANLHRISSHDPTRGRLRSTPDKVNEWYKIGPITEELMRGIFEHVYRARKEPPTTKKHIEDNGFPILQESSQRPRRKLPENIAEKKRKLTASSEVTKARKAKKLQEKADGREEKRKTQEQKKEASENSKKTKAAAKAKERKKRRAKPPAEAKRAREGETQEDQDQGGAKKEATKSCTESDQGTEAVGAASKSKQKKKKDKGSKTNHVNSSNSIIEKFLVVVVTTQDSTEVSNINKGIYPKGTDKYGQVHTFELTRVLVLGHNG
jgi:hypothetical protein